MNLDIATMEKEEAIVINESIVESPVSSESHMASSVPDRET